MASKKNKRERAKAITQGISPDAVMRAYFRYINQLKILRKRVNDRVPLWREAFSTGQGWSTQTDELRLDFECYITVLARFIRLCRTIIELPAFANERIVKEIVDIRNCIVEHGLDDATAQGDRGFFCGDQGPMLVKDGGMACLSMAALDDGIEDLLDRYKLKSGQIADPIFRRFQQRNCAP